MPCSSVVASTAAATGSTQIRVALTAATIRLTAPKSVLPHQGYSITGSLAFGTGSPAVGTALTVIRKNPNGSTSQVTGVKTTNASGSFGFSQPAESAVRLVSVMRQFESLQKAMSLGTEMNRLVVEQVAKPTS